jgi:hypothetical protein
VRIDLRTLAYVRCTMAAIAVERYRLAHGHVPESLAIVARQFPDAIRQDPFTRKPLQYKILDHGFVVYSVGEDNTDNDGTERNEEGNKFEPGTDIIFKIIR